MSDPFFSNSLLILPPLPLILPQQTPSLTLYSVKKKHGLSIEPTPDMLSYYIIYQLHIIIPDSVDSYISGIINQLEPCYPDA